MNTKSLTADKIYTCIKISRSALKCDKTLKLVDEHCILIIMIIDKLMKENGIINTSMNKVILVYNQLHAPTFFSLTRD